jgi:hypothetical protein
MLAKIPTILTEVFLNLSRQTKPISFHILTYSSHLPLHLKLFLMANKKGISQKELHWTATIMLYALQMLGKETTD